MRRIIPTVVLVASTAIAGCGSAKSPTGPDRAAAGEDAEAVPITGSERLSWGQPAASALQAASFKYRLLVDGSPRELSGVTCETDASGVAQCSAPLPKLSEGRHVLALIAVGNDGTEGPASASLTVIASGS